MSEKKSPNQYTFVNADVELPGGDVSPVYVFPAQGERDELADPGTAPAPLVAIWPGFGMGPAISGRSRRSSLTAATRW